MFRNDVPCIVERSYERRWLTCVVGWHPTPSSFFALLCNLLAQALSLVDVSISNLAFSLRPVVGRPSFALTLADDLFPDR